MNDAISHLTLPARHMTFPTLSAGEVGGEVVLCLHGFPDLNRTFRHQLPALAASGYHAVAPTLPGYHPSCQSPLGRYHLSATVDDLFGVLDALGAERAHVVGHDWGAVLGYGMAARAPERLLSLTAMAVSLPRGMVRAVERVWAQLRCSWYIGFFQLGRTAELRVEVDDWAFIDRLWRTWSPAYVCPSGEMRRIKEALGLPGVKAAALAYYRDAFDLRSLDARRTRDLFQARIQVPTLGLNGSQDGCMDPRFFALSMHPEDFPGGLEVKTIPGAGHFLHLEAALVVNRLILDWLRQHPDTTERL